MRDTSKDGCPEGICRDCDKRWFCPESRKAERVLWTIVLSITVTGILIGLFVYSI